VKRIAAPVAARVAVSRSPDSVQGAIVCFHGLGSEPGPETVGIAQFRHHVATLVRENDVVPLSQLVDGIERGKHAERPRVAITFDDGYRSAAQLALPVLSEHGAVATVFALPGRWGDTADWQSRARAGRELMTLDDAETWLGAGMTIGSHGMTHVDLTSVDQDRLDQEVEGSLAVLRHHFGDVDGFCYPWARLGDREEAAVRNAGYGFAVAGGWATYHRRDELFRLRRLTIDERDGPRDVRWKVRGGYDWISGTRRS